MDVALAQGDAGGMEADVRTALDLVNTRDRYAYPQDRMRTWDDLRTFLHAHGVAGIIGVDGDDLRAARQLRDDLRTAVDADDRMAAVAALLEGVHVVVRLRPGPVLGMAAPVGAGWRVRLQVAAVVGLARHLADTGPHGVRRCAAQRCTNVFVVRSATARRRYCTERCAARVRQHTRRQGPPGLPPPQVVRERRMARGGGAVRAL